jgi:hypothetical protein
LPFRRHAAIRVLAKLLDLIEIDVSVETYANPSTRPDVGRSKEAFGGQLDEISLNTVRRGAPEMREVVVVMTMNPQHGELSSNEEGRSSVTRAFRRFGQVQADSSYTIFEVTFVHAVTVENLSRQCSWRG